MSASEVARVLRIIANYATACAAELEADESQTEQDPPLSIAEQLEQAKADARERRKKLGGNVK